MKIRHIEINNFRGIKNLTWAINKDIVCLIGPGDSTKTTILDAIDVTLTSQYNYQFDDGDFYNCNTDNDIDIKLTIGDLPDYMLSEFKYGLYMRGWNYEEGLTDEPNKDGYENVLTIRLTVDKSLEPEWLLFTERKMEEKYLSNKQRDSFGLRRVSDYVDKHLSWGKGSALNKITDELKTENINDLMVHALRAARKEITLDKNDKINGTIKIANDSAKDFGVPQKSDYKANVDTKALMLGYSSIILTEEEVPLRLLGKGSKKLLATGLQMNSIVDGAIILIDEIETALEPNRICRLLRTIKEKNKGQFFITSHSDTVVSELGGNDLVVVRNKDGVTKCLNLSEEINGTIRKVPYGVFSKKVFIGEGKTEEGFLRKLESHWVSEGNTNFTYNGVSVIQGGGNTFFKIANDFQELGYTASCLIDTDIIKNNKDSEKEIEELKAKGVVIFNWEDNKSIEERIILDLPIEALQELIDFLFNNFGEGILQSLIGDKYNSTWGKEIVEWESKGFPENEYRISIGKSLKTKDKWLKNNSGGEKLAEIVINYLDKIKDKNSYKVIEEIKNWIYEG